MKTSKHFFLFLILLTFGSSCRKDSEDLTLIKNSPEPVVTLIQGNVLGKITDENNQGITDATITTARGDLIQTDSSGLFLLKNIKLNKNGAFLKAEKEGYFAGSRTFYPRPGSTNYINIQLIRKEVIGTFEAGLGGLVGLSNGANAVFPADAVTDETGALYTGIVEVSMHWLDPEAPATSLQMPGDLTGLRTDGTRNALQSYGMLAVELSGSSGQVLNLGNGKEAELIFPLPGNLASTAPSTIPLWYFDETKGIWVEEGEAKLENGQYVGQVSHFSFWNCDDPYELIKLSGHFYVHSSEPLENFQVKITLNNNGEIGIGQTDETGFFCGNVPKNQLLTLAFLNECGEVLYSQEIGPFSQNADLGAILISEVGNIDQFIRVKGNLVDCSQAPINDALVKVKYNQKEQLVYLNDRNYFEFYINVCNTSEIEIEAVSLTNEIQGITKSYPFNSGDTLLNLGLLWICNSEPDEYFYINTDSITGFFNDALQNSSIQLGGSGSGLIQLGDNISASGVAYLKVNNQLGSQPVTSNTFNIQLFTWGRNYSAQCGNRPCSVEEFEITEIGAIGEPIKGYVNASAITFARISNLPTYTFVSPIQIKFKVTREY